MTCAKNIKIQMQQEYDPATDYYKRFREAVQTLHAEDKPKNELANLIGELPANKHENFARMIEGYKKFLGKKEVEWLSPKREIWKHGNLEIPINPELYVKLNDQKHLIKLYMKAEKPSKDKVASILALMKHTISGRGMIYSVLDVRNSKLYTYDTAMDVLMTLVEGEANSLELMLNKI
mgnify:FL=1